MFELVDLYEAADVEKQNATDEAELAGGQDKTRHLKFKPLIEWMRQVRADQNAQYLKCLNWTRGMFEINNITTVAMFENVSHKSPGKDNVEETFAHAVKIAFKEDATVPAMSVAEAADLCEAIAKKCEEDGIDLNEVEVFIENEKGKLTYFMWYYDEGTDTAVIIKNQNPRNAAAFLKGGAENVVIKAAKTSQTSEKLIDELAKIQEQMAKLKQREDDVYNRMERMNETEDEDEDAGDENAGEKPAKKAKPSKK